MVDTLSPINQSVCKNGLIDQIIGTKTIIPGDSLSTIYNAGIPNNQSDIEATYQWQESSSPNGPWIDIFGAIQKNYTPQPVVSDRYFRRISRTHDCCGNTLVSTSNVASTLVNSLTAPNVDAGGIFNSCPSIDVQIDATVTGGTAPYQFNWDNGLDPIEDPTVAPMESTVYTLLVTDANGCKQISQSVVNTYSADAGPETVSVCSGDPIQIGGLPIPGVPGVTYSWSPTTDLSCSNCAQPLANPTTTTTYTLTLEIPITGGGTCQTTDEIEVSPITSPSNADFAGPDITICRGETGTLGVSSDYFLVPITGVSQSTTATGFAGTVANLTDGDFTTGARTNGGFSQWVLSLIHI